MMNEEAGGRVYKRFSTVFVFLIVYGYLLNAFPAHLMLKETITAGGDTASHYYPAKFLRDELLPQGDVIGWMPGWYAGMPVFQFYFTLPFIGIAMLGKIISLQVAFKLFTVLGVFMLPACMYLCVRLLGFRFPAPQFAAAFSLPFLFLENHSMWGGNIPSTLAGEFSYSISISLTILFIGSIYRGLKDNDRRLLVVNIIIAAAIALTHIYTILYVVCTILFFIIYAEKERLGENVKYLAGVFIPAFMISGFWSVPLAAHLEYTTSYNIFWVIVEEIAPPMIWPFCMIMLAGLYISYGKKRDRAVLLGLAALLVVVGIDIAGLDFPQHIDNTRFTGALADALFQDAFHARRILMLAALPLALQSFILLSGRPRFLVFSILVSFFFFTLASPLGVVDIRFIPFIYLSLLILSSIFLDKLTENMRDRWMLAMIVVLLCMFWVNDHRALVKEFVPNRDSLLHSPKSFQEELLDGEYEGFIHDWVRWNYDGFEEKSLWPAFREANQVVSGTWSDPRVVYEHNTKHNSAGTLRAFESLPLFSGRSTLEGLYMQSTPTSPFVFYIQSEVSEQRSCPFTPSYKCTGFSLADGVRHMQLFNVEYYIARSEKAIAAAGEASGLEHAASIPPFEIFRLTGYETGYVSVPDYEPVLVDSKDWKAVSYEWFKNLDLVDVPLVFNPSPQDKQSPRFSQVIEGENLGVIEKKDVDADCQIKESVGRDEINFTTSCPKEPHLVKISYHPGWHAEGADKVYLASPSFMMVYPDGENVSLSFGSTLAGTIGKILTVLGLIYTGYLSLSLIQNRNRLLNR